jgi:glutathionylspermidine synthase
MERVVMAERADWREQADTMGFRFHSPDGSIYWDESAHYRFGLKEIEQDLEAPTEEVHELCMDLVSRAVRDESYLRRLAIPQRFWEYIRSSYHGGEPHLYGRMDFAYDGTGPAKLYELNYDTPTSLYEAAVFQWVWLKQQIERGALSRDCDQFNSVHEKLLMVFSAIAPHVPGTMHFASVRESEEDRATVAYLADLAHQAGIRTQYLAIEDIGRTADGCYTDCEDRLIDTIFKLYPWEFMFADEYAELLETSGASWLEPPWKAILSNKGALALLWELYPGHPNLLPTYFEEAGSCTLQPGWVRKPLFSREGANVEILTEAGERVAAAGPYGDAPYVRQMFHPLPRFGDHHALVGSWVIGDRPAGIGIREDLSLITQDTARFVPHLLLG